MSNTQAVVQERQAKLDQASQQLTIIIRPLEQAISRLILEEMLLLVVQLLEVLELLISKKSLWPTALNTSDLLSEYNKHENQARSGATGTSGQSGLGQSTTSGNYDSTTGTGNQSSHLGRDAAIGGAGLGGVGLAEMYVFSKRFG
jgi:hypothetical protein